MFVFKRQEEEENAENAPLDGVLVELVFCASVGGKRALKVSKQANPPRDNTKERKRQEMVSNLTFQSGMLMFCCDRVCVLCFISPQSPPPPPDLFYFFIGICTDTSVFEAKAF